MNDFIKYTVVYAIYWQTGSHTQSITKYVHVQCKEEELFKCLEEVYGIDSTQVWFIFEGHCKILGEEVGEEINETD